MCEEEKVVWQKNVWLQKKARSRMVSEGEPRVESGIISVAMVLILRREECAVLCGLMGRSL